MAETVKNKVMVAIDESDCSCYALQWALQNFTPKLQTAGLILFNAISLDFSAAYATTYGFLPVDLITTLQENERKFAASLLERAKELCAKYRVDAEIVSVMGNPKEAICDAVQKFQCQLLIIGSHGRGAVQRLIRASLSVQISSSSSSPAI